MRAVYSQAELVVKILPAKAGKTQETQLRSLGWEDPLEKEIATHQYSCLEKPVDREP